jgi:hypothetical protein
VSFHSLLLRLIHAKKRRQPSDVAARQSRFGRAVCEQFGRQCASLWQLFRRHSRYQRRRSAVAILDARFVRQEDETTPVRVYECMPLTTIDLLTGIVAPWSAAFRGLDALAIDDGARRARFAAGAFPVSHDEGMVDTLEKTGITPLGEPAVNSPPGRHVPR